MPLGDLGQAASAHSISSRLAAPQAAPPAAIIIIADLSRASRRPGGRTSPAAASLACSALGRLEGLGEEAAASWASMALEVGSSATRSRAAWGSCCAEEACTKERRRRTHM